MIFLSFDAAAAAADVARSFEIPRFGRGLGAEGRSESDNDPGTSARVSQGRVALRGCVRDSVFSLQGKLRQSLRNKVEYEVALRGKPRGVSSFHVLFRVFGDTFLETWITGTPLSFCPDIQPLSRPASAGYGEQTPPGGCRRGINQEPPIRVKRFLPMAMNKEFSMYHISHITWSGRNVEIWSDDVGNNRVGSFPLPEDVEHAVLQGDSRIVATTKSRVYILQRMSLNGFAFNVVTSQPR